MPFPIDLGAGPLYGLTANVALPPMNALISIALILGVDALGCAFLKLLRLGQPSRWAWLRWQAPVVGAAFLIALLYPIALWGSFQRVQIWFIATAIAVAGVDHMARIAWHWVKDLRGGKPSLFLAWRSDFTTVLAGILLIGYGVLSLAPITEADSLDYHLGVAIAILNEGTFPFSPEWFHSRLAGGGEVLIALGLAIGAEQFGSLLQFTGLLGIVGILKHGFVADVRWRNLIVLAAIASPVFVAWIASPKPMILPAAMTTLALILSLTVLKIGDDASEAEVLSAYLLVCLLVMVAAMTKMNFLLSGGVIGSTALYYMVSRKKALTAILFGIASALLIMLPVVMWKHQSFGGTYFAALLTPFPGGWPGTDQFEAALRAYRDTQVPFPLSLLIPGGPGTISTVLGVGPILVLMALSRLRLREGSPLIYLAIAVAVAGAVIGQRNARFFIEPYIWALIFVLAYMSPLKAKVMKLASIGVVAQGLVMMGVVGVGVITLVPGSLTPELREKVMTRYANGYAELKWMGDTLPPGARVIVEPRSLALSPRYAIANDWRGYAPEPRADSVYSQYVSRKNPEYVLIITRNEQPPTFEGCKCVVSAGPFHTTFASRNPFNAGGAYDAWILRITNS